MTRDHELHRSDRGPVPSEAASNVNAELLDARWWAQRLWRGNMPAEPIPELVPDWLAEDPEVAEAAVVDPHQEALW